jgi:hypothetical protein
MRSEHTPGPWATMIDSTKEYIAVYAKVGQGTKVICPVKIGDKADAHLIAAAPDLLVVAQLVRLAPLQHGIDIPDELFALAEAAIAKAEGR